MSFIAKIKRFLRQDLWSIDVATRPRTERVWIQSLRLVLVAGTEFKETALSIRATGLVYTTLLALVPFLAVTLSVLKAFGIHERLEPILAQALEPLGPKGIEISDKIIGFVSNLHVGVLGVVGVAGLLLTTLLAINQIDHALNVVWRVRHHRPFGQKITNYLSVILVGPILVFTAFSLTASAQSHWLVQKALEMEPIGSIFIMATRFIPFILLCLAFTFLYKFVPYTEVRLTSALVGGTTAAIIWQFAGTLFAGFVASSNQYTAIYSGLAILILFMVWLYIAWVIVLAGAQVAYFYQYPNVYLTQASWKKYSLVVREQLALSALVHMSKQFLSGGPPLQMGELASAIHVPLSNLEDLIEVFIHSNIIYRVSEPRGITLARPPETVHLEEVLELVRNGERLGEQTDKKIGPIEKILEKRDQAVRNALSGMTLRTLLEDENLDVS